MRKKQSYLVVDTATDGLPITDYCGYSDRVEVLRWPRLVALSWLKVTRSGKKSVRSMIVKDSLNEAEADQGAIEINKITPYDTEVFGVDCKAILREFLRDVNSVDLLVAHNAKFDVSVLKAELKLRKLSVERLKQPIKCCTMEYAAENCKWTDGMWPTLNQLYARVGSSGDSFKECSNTTLQNVYKTEECFKSLRPGISNVYRCSSQMRTNAHLKKKRA